MPLAARVTRSAAGPRVAPYTKRSKATSKTSKTTTKSIPKGPKPIPPPLNPVPTPPASLGPSTNLWLWGNADSNNLGKCPFELGLYKPTKNTWLKTKDVVLFGGDGIQLAAVAAGGIVSVILD